ncbi:SigE family RNA polymerase sigma factor [Catenulispora subtropica]|uniref:SigE family RNA polymerase sigma factor n=1 Tax=Catenulispora subtropica TaxID=450798 RepID=A0ABN2STF9_9ACTN
MDEHDEAGFREYAVARQSHLRRVGFLLCGDWHLAEDLAQTTLVKLYAVWPRVRRGREVDAFARRVLYRTFLTETRRRRWHETPTEVLPDVAEREDPIAQRLVVRQALMTLPPKCRAVLLLRFWEDLSVEATADALGCGTGTVKSQTSRGLMLLRARLGDGDGDSALPGSRADTSATRTGFQDGGIQR